MSLEPIARTSDIARYLGYDPESHKSTAAFLAEWNDMSVMDQLALGYDVYRAMTDED